VRFDTPPPASPTRGATLRDTVLVPLRASGGGGARGGGGGASLRLAPLALGEAPRATAELFATVALPSGAGGGAGAVSGSVGGAAALRFPQMTRALPAGAATGTAALVAASGAAELDSMWMAGFLDYDAAGPRGDARGVLAKQLGEYEVAFGVRRAAAVSVAAPAALVAAHAAAAPAARAAAAARLEVHADAGAPRGLLSGAEIQRLRELEARAAAEGAARAARADGVKARVAATPYARENGKLVRLLALRGEAGGRKLQRLFRPPPKALASTSMDNLLWLGRIEAQAAVVLQRAWRARLKARFWRNYVREARGALAFQKLWRKFWKKKVDEKKNRLKVFLAVEVQALERGRAERKNYANLKQAKHEAAGDIQRVYRGWYWRRKARDRNRKREATKIQRAWRGRRPHAP